MKDYRSYSFWLDDASDGILPRPSLDGPIDVDVAIVGAGFTGLWTAYYLTRADPHLDIAILEKDVAGFGASGRNGGWVSPFFATPLAKLAESHGRDAAVQMQHAMFDSVDEIGRVCDAERIDAGFHKGGSLWLSTSPSQTPRVKSVREGQRVFGFGDEDWRWLERREVLQHVHVEGCLGGLFSPRYASVHPGRLVRGLATVVENRGVSIFERTPALTAAPGRVDSPAGRVRADAVILATEAYTCQLPGHERDLVPVYDYMIATEPLSSAFWEEVGWKGREVISDGRYLFVYAQHTADDRIAIGGTVAPYYFGSRIDERYERADRVFDRVHRALRMLFPSIGDAAVTHRWAGVIGATRDWHSCVAYDPTSGFGWAGGYVGDGIATANLAGRTLADLLLKRDSDLVHLPWVGHHSKSWEPEPLRWIASTGVRVVMSHADVIESGAGRAVRWKPVLDRMEKVLGW